MRLRILLPAVLLLTGMVAGMVAGVLAAGHVARLPAPPADTVRTVAVTVDDLPVVRGRDLRRMQRITDRLLDRLGAAGISAVGFVNEVQLGDPPDSARVALLARWLDAGHELGNHTYAHSSFWDTPLEAFQADVVRGEAVTARLLHERGQRLRYFRHPYLNTGPDADTRAAFEAFLAGRGYTVAPVTIDNDEYVYALAYDRAEAAGDSATMARLRFDYVDYMERVFAFYEAFSRELIGREPAQVLLLHANALNADALGDLAAMMRRRGYRFVSLDEALQDPAYRLPDAYTGRSGLSWLQRWHLTRGGTRRPEPTVTPWVQALADAR